MNHYPIYDRLCRQRWNAATVWSFVTHRFPHLDEIKAMWFVVFFGYLANRFKINRHDPLNRIEFWDKGGDTPDGRSWQEHAADGKILLGCKPGSEFDEHEQFGVQARKGYSCASTMHEFLGIKDPAIKPILAAVVDNDLNGGKFPLGLARLSQAMFHTGNDPKQVIRWAFIALTALYKREQTKMPTLRLANRPNLLFPGKGLDRAAELMALWLLYSEKPHLMQGHDLYQLVQIAASGRSRQGKAWKDFLLAQELATFDGKDSGCPFEWAMRYTGKSKYQPARSVRNDLRTMQSGELTPSSAMLSLSSVLTAMEATGMPWEAIIDWTFAAIHARYQSARNYVFALKDVDVAIKAGGLTTVEWEGKLVKILSIVSDNRQIIGGAWKQGVDVLIVHSKSGHASLFFSKASFEGKADELRQVMDWTAAEVRTRDFARKHISIADPKVLRSVGSLELQRSWCYRPDICAIMNGGDSAAGVEATGINKPDMVEIVVSKFRQHAAQVARS